MKKHFWKENNNAKEKELTEICEKINKGELKITCAEIAKKLGTTKRAVIKKKSMMGLITGKKGLTFKNQWKESKMPAGLDETRQKRLQMFEMLKIRERSIGEISRELNRSKEQIIKFRDELVELGYAIKYDKERHQFCLDKEPERFFKSVDIVPLYKNHFKFGIISDTHIGSKYMQASLLYTAYEIGDKEEIEAMFHCGDVFDGINMYKGQIQELFLQGADEQLDWAVKNYPKLKGGRKTYIIDGSHDLSFKKLAGYTINRIFAKLREKDIIYRGAISAQFEAHKLQVELVHPSGGSAYALSYRAQRRAENVIADLITKIRMSGNVDSLPNISMMGHLHQMFWFSKAGIEYFSVPCLQAQTPYLQAKGLSPELGMFIIDVFFDDKKNVIEIAPRKKVWSHLVKRNDY